MSQDSGARSDGRARPLRVMQSFRVLRATTNPYLAQLVAALPDDVSTLQFSWRNAIVGRYDVLHVHWPEVLLQGRPGALRVIARRVLLMLLFARLRLSPVALVRTLHNVDAHERRAPVERWLLGWMDRATDLWIRLNPDTPLPTAAPSRTIVHGHYRDWFREYSKSAAIPGRVLSFGLIRPYKGIENLMLEFARIADDVLTLHVVGKPDSGPLEREVVRLAAADARITATLAYVDDRTLAAEIGSAELVVLPYRELHNSGALLLALSLDRPVLVPGNPVTRALRDEVGAAWITTFDGELTAGGIVAGMEWAGPRHPSARPDLTGREWPGIGEQHREAYRVARALRARRAESEGP